MRDVVSFRVGLRLAVLLRLAHERDRLQCLALVLSKGTRLAGESRWPLPNLGEFRCGGGIRGSQEYTGLVL